MTTSRPTVSILTPTYDHAAYIGPCIESVLAQTFPDWEQIIVDDGSNDETRNVVHRYDDPRIRLITQEHAGLERLGETYNKALAASRGDLIAILEGDDSWPADKLASQVPAFADPGVVLAFGIAEVSTATPRRLPRRIPPRKAMRVLRPDVLRNSPPGHALLGYLDARCLTFTYPCTVLIRRRALEAIGGFLQSPRLPVVDYPTFLRLALEGSFHYTPRVMGYWRVHPGGTTVNRLESILRGV
jgi:glycosyltransferase involved in cell wall biosynthesis